MAKVLYPLPELLLLLCGTVAGADDFVELALWGGEHLPFLRRFLPFARGIPRLCPHHGIGRSAQSQA